MYLAFCSELTFDVAPSGVCELVQFPAGPGPQRRLLNQGCDFFQTKSGVRRDISACGANRAPTRSICMAGTKNCDLRNNVGGIKIRLSGFIALSRFSALRNSSRKWDRKRRGTSWLSFMLPQFAATHAKSVKTLVHCLGRFHTAPAVRHYRHAVQ
jgi:hypothetical protein